jgi:hypothetical protein
MSVSDRIILNGVVSRGKIPPVGAVTVASVDGAVPFEAIPDGTVKETATLF